MITNPREQKICDKYGKPDSEGKVRCFECPLSKGDLHCKANSHYNRKEGVWMYDD